MTEDGGPTEAQLSQVRELCDGEVSYHVDGWRKLILMKELRIRPGVSRDALLCLNHDNPTYPTKLYIVENVGGHGLNWNENAYILGRQWFTFSWANVPNSLPLLEILAAHLSPLNREQAA